MTPERWAKVTHLFGDAAELPAGERGAFLDAHCGNDAELRAEVETMLRSDAGAGKFLETNAAAALDSRQSGARVGPWLLERLIGQGGMGAVWEASRADGSFRQRAALKFVRGGLEPVVAKRFLGERQILAGLAHPNIGRLLDGGTAPDGTPYLAMEFIDGVPLDVYCREEKPSLAQRLRVFLQVCAAVSYAHQRLIVHRDLKPPNVLVTRAGVPMLLDFGVARMLDASGTAEASSLTRAAPAGLTPAYASPEQIRGEPVTTASDVFSLGVVLYELVSEVRPFGAEARSAETIVKSVLEDEPKRPSTVTAGLRFGADLDSVVLKALEKDPSRRYGSVDLFAEDVRRFTTGQPVEAYEASFFYRAKKLVLRNRGPSALLALLMISLLVGISATSWQAHVASVERARAEKRFADVRALANSLIFEIHDAILYLPGATEARAKITRKAVEYLDDLAKEDHDDPQLDRELAAGYQKVAEAMNYSSAANLGDVEGAAKNYARALALREKLGKAPSAPAEDRAALAGLRGSLGVSLLEQGEVKLALLTTQEALEIRRSVLAGNPSDPELRRAAANTENYLADILTEAGDLRGALAAYQHVLSEYTALVALDPKSAKHRWGLICSESNVAEVQRKLADPKAARAGIERALSLNTALAVDRPDHYSVLSGFGNFHQSLGELWLEAGDFPAARAAFDRARSFRKGLAERDPRDNEAALLLARTLTSIGLLEAKTGNPAEATRSLDAATAALGALAPSRRVAAAQAEVLLVVGQTERAAGAKGGGCSAAQAAQRVLAPPLLAHPELASLQELALRIEQALKADCAAPP